MSTFDPERLLATLVDHEVEFVVIGLTAAWLQGAPAVTLDVDIMPRRELENAERLAAALNDLHARSVGSDAHVELEGADFLGWRTEQFHTDAGPLDVVPVAVGIGGYEDIPSVVVYLGDRTLRLAALDAIIASKEQLDRPKDRAALPALYAAREARRHRRPQD